MVSHQKGRSLASVAALSCSTWQEGQHRGRLEAADGHQEPSTSSGAGGLKRLPPFTRSIPGRNRALVWKRAGMLEFTGRGGDVAFYGFAAICQ